MPTLLNMNCQRLLNMKHILLFLMCLLFISDVFAQNQRDTTYTDQRQGFEREHFVFQGRKAWLIKPTKGFGWLVISFSSVFWQPFLVMVANFTKYFFTPT